MRTIYFSYNGVTIAIFCRHFGGFSWACVAVWDAQGRAFHWWIMVGHSMTRESSGTRCFTGSDCVLVAIRQFRCIGPQAALPTHAA